MSVNIGDGKKKKKPKILRDKDGNYYIHKGKKKIFADAGISHDEFLKWLIKYLAPKAEKRKPLAAPGETAQPKPRKRKPKETARPLYELPPGLANDETARNTVNIERKRAGLYPLEAPDFEGGPAVPDVVTREKRRKKDAEKLRNQQLIENAEAAAKRAEEQRALAEAAHGEEKKRRSEVETAHTEEKKAHATVKETALDRAKRIARGEFERKWGAKELRTYLDVVDAPIPREAYLRNTRGWKKEDFVDFFLNNPEKKDQRGPKTDYEKILKIEMQKGHGGGDSKGTTNTEIDQIMAPYRPQYLGTIARDGWNQLAPAPHTGSSAWIMNTDKTGKPGMHWVAFFMDLDRHTIEYYNSFADDIPADVLVSLKKFLQLNNPTKQYLKLKVNRIVDQSATSSNCGWFCMRFIIDRFRGRPWRECTKFDEHVKGEEAIDKWKKQYGGEYSTYL